jgi:hypothetical protein
MDLRMDLRQYRYPVLDDCLTLTAARTQISKRLSGAMPIRSTIRAERAVPLVGVDR